MWETSVQMFSGLMGALRDSCACVRVCVVSCSCVRVCVCARACACVCRFVFLERENREQREQTERRECTNSRFDSANKFRRAAPREINRGRADRGPSPKSYRFAGSPKSQRFAASAIEIAAIRSQHTSRPSSSQAAAADAGATAPPPLGKDPLLLCAV